MRVPRLAEKLARQLFPEAHEEFIGALFGERDYAPCVMWLKDRPSPSPFETVDRPDWAPSFVDFLAPGQRPGQSEWQEQGALYVLDPSSVAEASILLNVPGQVRSVLDVCSAPGGKGIFAWRMFAPGLLAANDALRKRLGMLAYNLERCQVEPSLMLSEDPSSLKEHLAGQFDLAIVDAPCSGQSMAAKGKESGGGYHPATVNQNSNRQKRILACAAATVAPGGALAYMTCTYSPEENEEVVSWLLKRFPEFEPVPLGRLAPLQSHLTDIPCARVWPHVGPGAGGFSCLLRRTGGEAAPIDHEWLAERSVPKSREASGSKASESRTKARQERPTRRQKESIDEE